MHRLIAILGAACLLSSLAGSAVAATFDPVRDRDQVVKCAAADYGPSEVMAETWGMPPAEWKPLDRVLQERTKRLTPFLHRVTAIFGDDAFYHDAALAGRKSRNRWVLIGLLPGGRARAIKEMMADSERCDALVRSWPAQAPPKRRQPG